MHTVPQIDNGKTPSDNVGVWHMIPLPADTPFGNLLLKHYRIVERLDHVNVSIQKAFASYDAAKSRGVGGLTEHALLAEEVIYWLRKTADELIGLVHILAQREETGVYPGRVDPDSIGALLASKDVPPLFAGHVDFLTNLNEIANAYKHSFINSDLSLMGRDEPVVHALALKRNNLANVPQFYSVALRDVVHRFSAFFKAVDGELRRFHFQHLASTAATEERQTE